jgi:foldase protein PrsA
MSLVRMRKTMHDKLPLIMLALALVFAVGWIGLCLGSGRGGGATKVSDQSDTIAVVNGQKIDRQAFEAQVKRMTDQVSQQRQTSAFEEAQIRGNVLDSMTQSILYMDAAKKEGVRVGRGEINKAIDQYVDSQMAQMRSRLLGRSKDTSDKALDAALQRQGMSLSQLKDEIRGSIDKDRVEQQLTMQGLMKKLQDKVDSSDRAVRASFDQVRFSQITVSAGTRSDEQSQQRVKLISDKLKQTGDFAAVAKEYSEDPFKAKGGDRGEFISRSPYYDKTLMDKVFSMQPGEVSEPIKLASGYVIVKLDQKRNAVPPDYATDPKKRKQYRDAYVQEQQSVVQSQFMAEMQKNTKIDIKDPEMKAYMATKAMSGMMGGAGGPSQAKAKADEAIGDLRTAINRSTGDPQAMARIYAQLAYLYEWLGKPGMFNPTKAEQAKYMAEEKTALTEALNNTESNDLRTMMVDINMKEGQYDKALEHLQFVSANSGDDAATHQTLLAKYQELKKYVPQKVAPLIASEQKWLANYNKQQAALKKQGGGTTSQPFQVTPQAQDAARRAQGGG